jgi:hypothetical protein
MMKKLLFLLLSIPMISFAQDFKVGMNSGADANVGEEIELKFEIFPAADQSVTGTFLQFDVQWNNKLIEYVSHTLDPLNKLTNEQSARIHWDGYKFNQDMDYSQSKLYEQFLWWNGGAEAAGSSSYPSNTDFSVDRYTIQASEDINLYDAVLHMKFKILDRQGTNYQNYSGAFQINWTQFKDNRTDTTYEVQSSNAQIGLDPGGVGAGDITLNLNIPTEYKADYTYNIYLASQVEEADYDGDGTNDGLEPKEGEQPFAVGNFNANGTTSLATLTLDEEVWVHTYVNGTPDWLDDVVTVTDVYKAFQFSLGSTDGPGGGAANWEHEVQGILGEVTNDNVVNFDDSYELLAHVNGVETSANVSSKANGAFNFSSLMDKYGDISEFMSARTFTATDNNKTFTIGHGLRGDLDFSHSTVPTFNSSDAQSSSARNAQAYSIIANRSVETETIDLSSSLVDGKVIVDVNLDTAGLVGSQFKIVFDNNILTLDDIVFDTGSNMTNFGTVKGNVVSFGSLDYAGGISVNTGRPYRLVFTPNENITNTAGLISFKIIEGVKADGTKVKFQY